MKKLFQSWEVSQFLARRYFSMRDVMGTEAIAATAEVRAAS